MTATPKTPEEWAAAIWAVASSSGTSERGAADIVRQIQSEARREALEEAAQHIDVSITDEGKVFASAIRVNLIAPPAPATVEGEVSP